MEESWESSVSKHIFILSSAGKPIFSRYGDEQEIVTTFGLIQAVISIVQDSGEQLQCIQAGPRRIVYYSNKSLFFVAMSSTGEPEAVLRQQLIFMYYQIIFVLTSKVHDILKSNPSKDLRELLGSDTKRLMHAACEKDITPPTIVFNSVKSFALDGLARMSLLELLSKCLRQSSAALGCIICEESLVVFSTNEEMQVSIDAKDILLLTHFVHNSPSLRCHDQNNWVPLCLPSLNDTGYVQLNDSQSLPLNKHSNPSSLSLVLISASNGNSDDVKRLHDARVAIQKSICENNILNRLEAAIANQGSISENLLLSVNAVHFFYKYKPSAQNPAQCIWSPFSETKGVPMELNSRIWIHCFRLALCLRDGSSTPECTLLSAMEPAVDTTCSSNGGAKNEDSNVSSELSTSDSPRMNAGALSCTKQSTTGCSQRNALSSLPAADHALAYTILDSGEICVGLATSYSELFVTFPNTVDALEACGLANLMTRYLRRDAESLFFAV